MNTIDQEYLVVGLGAFGSAALWRLAARGADVAGIEQFHISHDLGSSHGLTRLFRIACQEHPLLSPIAQRSLDLWRQLEEATGMSLVQQTGCLNVGPPDRDPIAGTIAAAERSRLPLIEFSHDELLSSYSNHSGWGADDVGILDPQAGICFPEAIIREQVRAAEQLGARVYPTTKVLDVEFSTSGVTVTTATAVFRARTVVLAAGAWLARMLPQLPLQPRRTPLNWFEARPSHTDDYSLEKFPAFIRALPSGMELWGHGSGEGFGIKLGMWDDGSNFDAADTDSLDRYVHQDRDIDQLARWVNEAFADIVPTPRKVIPCMVTNTPDGQFVLGRSSFYPGAIVAGGDSGHGFKHAAGLGDLIASLAVGEETYCETDFMDPNRFAMARA